MVFALREGARNNKYKPPTNKLVLKTSQGIMEMVGLFVAGTRNVL